MRKEELIPKAKYSSNIKAVAWHYAHCNTKGDHISKRKESFKEDIRRYNRKFEENYQEALKYIEEESK